MKKYTKLALATLCFISSLPAFADGYKGEAPPLVPVTIPVFAGGFEFTLGALYMTPQSSNLTYLSVSSPTVAFPNAIIDRVSYDVHPNYDWGFLLGLGYVFPGTSNDVKLDWMYFHNSYSSSEFILGVGQTAVFVPAYATFLSGGTTLNAVGKVDYQFDAVDLTFGQYLNFGSRLQTRLFTGLRYMKLDDDLSTAYFADGTGLTTTFDEAAAGEVNSSFNGLGPLAGVKADYYLGAGWSLSGGLDGALLVGQLSLNAAAADFNFTQVPPLPATLTSASAVSYSYDSLAIIAPAWDAKFGLNYKYQFNNGTLLGLELGYQVTKYIDVVGQLDGTDSASDLTPDHNSVDVTNFRLAGPYLTLNVKV